MKIPLEEALPYRFSGTKAAGSGLTTLSEIPTAYQFDNAQLALFCPDEAAFFSGEAESYSYSRFFGADAGELIFDTGKIVVPSPVEIGRPITVFESTSSFIFAIAFSLI